MKSHHKKICIFLFPIALFLFFLCLKIAFPELYLRLIQEDSVLEYAQAVAYFFSAVISLLAAGSHQRSNRALQALFCWVLAAGFLFVALEEVSWGQRIFSVQNPAFFQENNVQKEISLHNLEPVQPFLRRLYIIIGAYGAFAWLFVSRLSARSRRMVAWVVPEWQLSSYFIFSFIVYLFYGFVASAQGFFLWRDQEICELMLSLGFFFYAINKFRKSRRSL